MYVHEFLKFAGSLHISSKSKRTESIKNIIEKCGLTREQNKKIGTLSKGYRQRVGLAQALLHDPKVLILDEPTTGLDPNQIIEIRNLIKASSKNKTVIFSTHIMQEVQALCDRVIIINNGKIVADASPEELKKVNTAPRIVVQFNKAVDVSHFSDSLQAKQIESLENNKYRIFQNGLEDIRPKIYQYSTDNKLTLLQLAEEESNMEDIFRKLTIDKE
jgi:ABC-2 type transport system ATP-binding protein